MRFTKWQGCGNDFVLIDCREKEIDYAAFARKVCDRHYGVGADGVLVVLPSAKADIRMREFNTDGSEAEMCGNGIRCFARYLYDNQIIKKTKFTVETFQDVLVPEILLKNGEVTGVRVDMGEPILAGEEVPVTGWGREQVVDEPVEVAGETYRITAVSMGNPHCVVFVDDAEHFPLEEVGPAFESQPRFPRRTNTEFVEVRDRQHVRMRVYERGAGVTLACGTGSCATLVAGVLTGRTDRRIELTLDGGRLVCEWDEATNHVFMTGPAEQVFTGEID